MTATAAAFISPSALLEHWQGHRRVTRRAIEAFPEDELFEFSIGGMRTFGELAHELLSMGIPMVRGLATGQWDADMGTLPDSRAGILDLWDRQTAELDETFPKIPVERFAETVTSFDTYTGTGHWQILYVIDNEIHHRGQGYVYLRALEIEPPLFYER